MTVKVNSQIVLPYGGGGMGRRKKSTGEEL